MVDLKVIHRRTIKKARTDAGLTLKVNLMLQNNFEISNYKRHRMAETSLEAYAKILPKLSDRKRKAFSFIASRTNGATNDELSECFGWPPQSMPSITGSLRDAGLIIESGDKRLTRFGHPASVWRVK